MSIYQGQAREIVVKLVDAGSPVSGVAFDDIDVFIRKAGEIGFLTGVVLEEHWKEVGYGWYALSLSSEDTAFLGPLIIRISPDTTPFDLVEFQDDVDVAPLDLMASPQLCRLSGNVIDIGADPTWNVPVNFRIANPPATVDNSFIDVMPKTSYTDVYGNFTIFLLRGAQVVVGMDRTAIHHTITIPDQESALLKDLLPPI